MAEYNMQGKVGIVTGANAGIGKRVALGMAQAGATVIMACRSAERGAAARREVIAQSGNSDVHLLQVDLSSQASIRAAVASFEARFGRLDVLIDNAANFDHRLKAPILTAEGIETVFATNHLGPFLLTNLLLPRLKASAPARVIDVASKGLIAYPRLSIEFDNLNGQRKFSMQHAYYHSKLAQVMFTYDLAERLADQRRNGQRDPGAGRAPGRGPLRPHPRLDAGHIPPQDASGGDLAGGNGRDVPVPGCVARGGNSDRAVHRREPQAGQVVRAILRPRCLASPVGCQRPAHRGAGDDHPRDGGRACVKAFHRGGRRAGAQRKSENISER